ncbi:hypothetical protein CAC02_04765 [Streptococcus gallolyticus]|uniref:Uncharacterized protein n=1 Tax=Streptococcus gallolyticus TaxID=315405 RepID=A0A368UDT4_9STRE|nr:hypothetical protein [Streptococcus gallolyticus]RCW17105.1 hypothetical protein CAC02_04765 [Streptococcus gallolyticus]
MRLVFVFGVLLLSLLFYCGDAKAELADHIYCITLDMVEEKMLAKEEFFLFIGRMDNVDTQRGLSRLESIDQTIYFLDTREIAESTYQQFAKQYHIQTLTHLAHFKGQYQFAVANVLTVDLASFLGSRHCQSKSRLLKLI